MDVVKWDKSDKFIDIEVYGQSGQTHVLIVMKRKLHQTYITGNELEKQVAGEYSQAHSNRFTGLVER